MLIFIIRSLIFIVDYHFAHFDSISTFYEELQPYRIL